MGWLPPSLICLVFDVEYLSSQRLISNKRVEYGKKDNLPINKENYVNTEGTSKSFIITSTGEQVKDKMDPFRKSTKTAKEDFFDVGFEDSQSLTATLCTLSQNSNIEEHAGDIFRNSKKFGVNKNKVEDPFDIDFEDSKEASQDVLNTPQTESQKSNETCSQDSTINFKKLKLFKNPKLHSNNAFDIDFEESGQALSQNTQHSQGSSASSQKSVDKLSQGEIGKPSLFQNHKRRVNAFEVDFEESCQNEMEADSQNTQISQSAESDKENVEDTSISFEKPDPFLEAKKQQLNKPFDLDFEESRNITNVHNNSHTPTKSGVVPFRKSSRAPKESDFSIDFSQTDFGNNLNDLTEKSGQIMRSDPPISRTHSFTSELSHTNNITENASTMNQSSFNDENLNHWMSDQSEDEIDIARGVTPERSCRITLPPDEICPVDNEQEEDHMQQLELKLKEIIDSARNGKVEGKSPISIREKDTEKPKMIQKKRKAFVKPALKKPASFATKRLYGHIITKIRPKYGIDSVVHAEELVIYMCDVVKTVLRRKAYQKKLINDLKVEMAKMGIIETTYQFYEFIREFLPYEFRLKSVPCIQPGTNIVYPPKDAVNPFQKIL